MSSGARKQRILNPNQSYTFRSYFEMRFPITDILWELGVHFNKSNINFPKSSTTEPERLLSLRQRLEEAVFRVSLTSESARQQVLIAPILLELAHVTELLTSLESSTGNNSP
ncbi:hypothetical protein DSM106972_054560 [Dulcicalothrix desertica PCC 7102]|uniref:Uncharacterized protein n=1 Tax=Dulcicalothrix desertica PCC 7102 TaxID=232991 RepID=A0A3S1CGQ3_9CYAN|nr:hypothetical protein [Dulcicalothrix desertica]RUT03148.1 hypothetical protein DSM106972_054560 [Dulcicalothrix desertica PCC 7102]TWH53521.1 hypothetical protein CAL7102_01481 [Dulcicalothrix desertica PCC 7102]